MRPNLSSTPVFFKSSDGPEANTHVYGAIFQEGSHSAIHVDVGEMLTPATYDVPLFPSVLQPPTAPLPREETVRALVLMAEDHAMDVQVTDHHAGLVHTRGARAGDQGACGTSGRAVARSPPFRDPFSPARRPILLRWVDTSPIPH